MYERMWNKDFVLLIMSNFLMYITYYAVISVLPIYLVSELHATKSQVGVVVAAYTIASVLIRPFSGFTLDRFSRRVVFLVALVIYTMLFAGYLVAITMTALILLRFAQGLTWGFTTISGSTIAVDIIPAPKRGEGIGYFGLSTTLGMSVGPVIGLFVCHHWGYTVMFVSGLFISLASLVCAYFIHLPHQSLEGKLIPFKLNNLFDKKSIRPSLNVLIIMSTYGGLLSFIALYGREIGVQNTSLFFLIFACGIATSRLAAGKTFDRKGPGKIITLCVLLLIIGFPLLAMVQNAAGFYIAAIIIGFGVGVVFPVFQSMVNNLADANHRGAANSTLYTALDIGMGFGMIMAGLIAEYISIAAIFAISSVVCVIGLIFFRLFVLKFYENNQMGV
jgi:MFS family permease